MPPTETPPFNIADALSVLGVLLPRYGHYNPQTGAPIGGIDLGRLPTAAGWYMGRQEERKKEGQQREAFSTMLNDPDVKARFPWLTPEMVKNTDPATLSALAKFRSEAETHAQTQAKRKAAAAGYEAFHTPTPLSEEEARPLSVAEVEMGRRSPAEKAGLQGTKELGQFDPEAALPELLKLVGKQPELERKERELTGREKYHNDLTGIKQQLADAADERNALKAERDEAKGELEKRKLDEDIKVKTEQIRKMKAEEERIKADIGKKGAETKKIGEQTKTIAPESQAKIDLEAARAAAAGKDKDSKNAPMTITEVRKVPGGTQRVTRKLTAEESAQVKQWTVDAHAKLNTFQDGGMFGKSKADQANALLQKITDPLQRLAFEQAMRESGIR